MLSRSDSFSLLYATMLVLIGFVFPISEALRNEWMTSHVIGIFMTYLFLVASTFIIYLHVYEHMLKKRQVCRRKQSKTGLQEQSEGVVNHALDLLGGSGGAQEEEDDDDDDDFIELPGITVSNEGNNHRISTVSATVDPELQNYTQTRRRGPLSEPRSMRMNSHFDESLPENCSRLRQRRNNLFALVTLSSEAPDEIYDFITEHQGTATLAGGDTNLFLKGGTLLFAVANLIYIALRIDAEHRMSNCVGHITVIYPHYFHLLFIVLQTFMLAKESKFALRRRKQWGSFGLMHLAATNLCVWFRFLVFEVMNGLNHGFGNHVADEELHADDIRDNDTMHGEANFSSDCDFMQPAMTAVEPFLFPFILEYSLVAMSTVIFLYGNINIQVSKELFSSISSVVKEKRQHPSQRQTISLKNTMDKSHTGLSLGVLLFAGVAVSMVMFFYLSGGGNEHNAQLCFFVSKLGLLILLTMCTAVGMLYLHRFECNLEKSNNLDHMLLFLPYVFLITLELFTIMAMATHMTDIGGDLLVDLSLTCSIFAVIQSTSQIAFVVDGMQRITVEKKDLEKKQGRGVITLLVIANVAMWMFKSFQEKKSDQTVEVDMFGELAWTIISNVALPLELFFYFHSAMCLAHMWTHCYEEPEPELVPCLDDSQSDV